MSSQQSTNETLVNVEDLAFSHANSILLDLDCKRHFGSRMSSHLRYQNECGNTI